MGEKDFRVRKGLIVDGTGTSSIAGSLGIGTTSPGTRLHLSDAAEVTLSVDSSHATGSQISLDATGTGGHEWRLVSAANDATGITDDTGAFGLYSINGSSNGYKLVVEGTTGNVGIGTTSPVSRLDLNTGALSFANTDTQLKLSGGSNVDFQLGHWGNTHILIDTDGNDSSRYFSVRHGNATASSATELFKVHENGTTTVTGSLEVSSGITGEVQPKATTAVAGNSTPNYYAKLLTFNPNGNTHRDCNLILGVTVHDVGNSGSAIINVKFRSFGATQQYTADVAFMSKTGTSVFDQDAFQIFSDGNLVAQDNNTDIELWVKKNVSYASLEVHEISKAITGNTTLTYHTDSAWQSSAPTNNTFTTTTQGIELNLDKVRMGISGVASFLHLHPQSANSYLTTNTDGSNVTLAADEDLTLHADDDIFFQSGGATKMTLLDSGNLGIGTTSPSTPLHVRTTTTSLDNVLLLENNGGSGSPGVGIKMFSNVGTTNYLEILHDAFGATNFKTVNGSDTYNKQVHLQSDGDVSFEAGKVGIGVTAPTDTLAVSGGIKIGEFNSTDGTGYAGTSPPSDHNNATGASDPQIRVAGRTSDQPGIIQMAMFDNNNFFGGTGAFTLGKLQFAMNENSNTVTTVAEIRGITSDPQVAGNFDGALKFFTSQGDTSSANLTEKMILTADGNLGIGTTSPSQALDVSGSITLTGDIYLAENKKIYFDSTDTYIYADTDSSEDLKIGADGHIELEPDNDLIVKAGTTEYVRFDGSTQRVGIGTTSPQTPLHVVGNVMITNTDSDNTVKDSRILARTYTNNDYNLIYGYADATTNRLYLGGGTGTGEPATDIRFFTAALNADTDASGTEKARFDSAGHFLIGTTSYSGTASHAALEVSHGTQANLRVTDSSASASSDFAQSENDTYIVNRKSGGDMKFRVNGSNEIMTFDGTNQRVGIGDTTPSTKLEVAGTITATGLNLQNGSLDYGGGKQQTADLATGWYTFAVCKGRDATISAQRAFGEFLINDVDSGRHGSCRLNATHFFGNGNSIQVFAYNFYSVAVFDELRIKDGGTYSGAALQVYVSNANNNLETYMTMSEQNQSWELLDTWLLDTDNTGHDAILGYGSDAWTNFAVSQEIDLSIFDVSQGGIYTTGGMYAEELELKDATGITIQTANSNARHKKIFATTSNDGSPFDEMVYYSRGSTGGWSGQHTFTVDKSGTSGTGYEALRIRDSGNGTSSEVLVSHKLGVGILDPVPMLHIYGDNATTNQTTSGAASITIEQDGAGDAALNFLLTGTRRWIMGIDNSLSDKFVLSTGGTDLNTGAKLSVNTSGDLTMAGGVNGTNGTFTGLMTSGTALINSSHSFSNTPAITTNGVAINGTNTTKVRAESSTYSFSQSYLLAGNLNTSTELELFRFNVTNASYRKFQAGRMFIRVQVTNPQSGGSGFFQQTVTFGDDASGGAAQSTTDRIDSFMTGGNTAYDHEKATIVVSRVSDYICVKFRNDTGDAILTSSGFQAQLSCELFELDAMPS